MRRVMTLSLPIQLSEKEHWSLTKRVMTAYLIVAFAVVALLAIAILRNPHLEATPSNPLLWFIFGPIALMLVAMIAFQAVFDIKPGR